MLSSPRSSLVSAPWRLALSRRARKSTPRPPKPQSFSTVIARFPGFLLDSPVEWTPARNTFRNYATSSQSLHLLIQEKKYDEAAAMLKELCSRGTHVQPHPVYIKAVGDLLSRRVLGGEEHGLLVDWLELVPDASSSTSASTSFESLLDDLRHHIKTDSALAVSVGRALARKGYKTLVEREILPLVKSAFGNDVYSSLLQETSQLSAARSASTSANSSEVFEDTSEDYSSIMAASVPLPSVLEQVETSLPSTLPLPDPSNQSVFEEPDDDYAVPMSASRHFPRQSATGRLEQLVREKKYDDALQLFSELVHLDAPITFSHLYSFAALDALSRPLSEDYTPDAQQKLFTTWLSLTPFEHENQPQSRLQLIRQMIMIAPVTNLSLIMQFCSILSAKGYVDLIGRQELAVIMRFAPVAEINKFIHKLESANSAYWKSYRPENATVEPARFKRRVRNLSIRYLAYSGRVEEAIDLIPEHGSKIGLSSYTLEKLLLTIRDCNDPSFTRQIPHIESLLHVAGPDPLDKFRQMRSDAEDAAIAAGLRTMNADVDIGTLPQALRYLRRCLRSGDLPHPFVITDFLQRYLATGRTTAPTLLLNLCLNTSFRSTSLFVLAEMLYYRRMGLTHLVIKTFVDHFYITGVPREEILKIYHSHEHCPNSSDDDPDNSNTIIPRMCNFSPSQLPRGKAWPNRFHCSLVWHALVALTPSLSKHPELYHKLLDVAQGRLSPFTLDPDTTIEPLPPPPSWPERIASSAFIPFMRQMMWTSGPSRGFAIIRDMLRVGIRPTVYHYTELAGYCARMGAVGPALDFVNYLENGSGLKERLMREKKAGQFSNRGIRNSSFMVPTYSGTDHTSTSTSGSSSQSNHLEAQTQTETQTQTRNKSRVPEPDLIFYISLMRGFIISQSPEGFEKVHEHLVALQAYLPKKRLYRPQQEILDLVYRDYRFMVRRKGHLPTDRRAGYRNAMERRSDDRNMSW